MLHFKNTVFAYFIFIFVTKFSTLFEVVCHTHLRHLHGHNVGIIAVEN
jgi:hypothetical protein